MTQPVTPAFAILVSGDVIVDHHIYEGERGRPTTEQQRGVRDRHELGGAALVQKTLKCLLDQAGEDSWSSHLGIQTPGLDENPCGHHAYATWEPVGRSGEDDKAKVWRTNLIMGYGHEEGRTSSPCTEHAPKPLPDLPPPDILVLEDAGSEFRLLAQKSGWLLPSADTKPPEWILLKMSRPIAQGDLWHELVERFADRLICLVSADELRQECVGISQGLSWERTVEEVRDGLSRNPLLASLNRCRHLIVSFAADGALWVDRSDRKAPRATLSFDGGGAEGEWGARANGKVMGYSAPKMAALALSLARHLKAEKVGGALPVLDLAPAIEAGLSAARNLFDLGHGQLGETLPTDYPAARLAAEILKPTSAFARAIIPWDRPTRPVSGAASWTIVESSQRPLGSTSRPSLVGLARQVVLEGRPALKRLPHAVFGELVTADRTEIETLRTFKRLILGYHDEKKAKKPLSLGVFGPPGAGKSFGVKQIANEVLGKDAWLEFNLSQFAGPADLMGAFHQVRDLVLSGKTPAVFWDEFDSRGYFWLQYLLAPMQDGRFQEGQLNHAIGKCVFIFAGGTSHTFEAFGPLENGSTPEEKEAWQDFRLCKGPDFHSRLDAYYDVAGPNQRKIPRSETPDGDDVCHPLRRALLIRSVLKCGDADRLDFDSDLLDALLLVPWYKHGSRSLEKLVSPLKPVGGGPIRRSLLPTAAQLGMHVKLDDFAAILNRNLGFKMSAMIEILAEGIHETWRTLAATEGWKMQPHFDKPYAGLAEIDKEDNRAAARRIPEVLALAGLGIEGEKQAQSDDAPSETDIRSHLEHHMERLAEAEHDGWMDQRLRNGWHCGTPRDDARKIHPLLIPYSRLPDKEKGKDRNSVRHFPDMVARAGYRIVWLKG